MTDSTAYLPAELVERFGIDVVPLQVTIGDRCGDEGREVTPDEVTTALLGHAPVSTSRPTPGRFEQAYAEAAAAGATGVVAVTISAALSATYESAGIAADVAPCEVRCVDSRTTVMGLGFAVLAAARAAADGRGIDEVARAAEQTAAATRTLFYVDTLDYLRRGGRIGRARALVGTALAVKPILHMVDGEIALLDKVRTASRGRARLIDLAVQAAGDEPVDVAVHHAELDDGTDTIAAELRERLPKLRELVTTLLGAAVTVHTGPRAIGIVVSPA